MYIFIFLIKGYSSIGVKKTFFVLFQTMRTGLHLLARLRTESKLWLYKFRHIWLGIFVSFPTHDSRLLGKSLSIGNAFSHHAALFNN